MCLFICVRIGVQFRQNLSSMLCSQQSRFRGPNLLTKFNFNPRKDTFVVKSTFELLTVCGQQHSFSNHERMFFWKCWNLLYRKCLNLRWTRIPNLRFHAEISNHLSYQGQTFAVPCFEYWLWRYTCRYFCSKVNVWNINCARATAFILAWISNYIHYIEYDKITYPFPNYNGATVKAWECISNFTHTLLCMWLLIHAGIKVNLCL